MTALATELLDEFHDKIQLPHVDSFTAPALYEKLGNEWTAYFHHKEDIYELLEMYTNERDLYVQEDTPSAVVVITTGWAAPLGENGQVEGAPSKHPQRVRVMMSCCVEARGGLVHRLELHKPEGVEVSDDYGSATGSLADALNLLGFATWGRDWTSSLILDYAQAIKDGNADKYPDELVQAMKARIGHLVRTVIVTDEEEEEEQ